MPKQLIVVFIHKQSIMAEIIILQFVTGPAKTRYVGTKYALALNESYLVTGIEYFHSVTCITMPEN